jgi:AICAR transformylase/IMP cyclohydrolase PurH
MIEGKSGVINYGEIFPLVDLNEKIEEGDALGLVMSVLPHGKKRDDIVGHSCSMLHIELYKHGTRAFAEWLLNQEQPEGLLNPKGLINA